MSRETVFGRTRQSHQRPVTGVAHRAAHARPAYAAQRICRRVIAGLTRGMCALATERTVAAGAGRGQRGPQTAARVRCARRPSRSPSRSPGSRSKSSSRARWWPRRDASATAPAQQRPEHGHGARQVKVVVNAGQEAQRDTAPTSSRSVRLRPGALSPPAAASSSLAQPVAGRSARAAQGARR